MYVKIVHQEATFITIVQTEEIDYSTSPSIHFSGSYILMEVH